jgi:hypothetical protein
VRLCFHEAAHRSSHDRFILPQVRNWIRERLHNGSYAARSCCLFNLEGPHPRRTVFRDGCGFSLRTRCALLGLRALNKSPGIPRHGSRLCHNASGTLIPACLGLSSFSAHVQVRSLIFFPSLPGLYAAWFPVRSSISLILFSIDLSADRSRSEGSANESDSRRSKVSRILRNSSSVIGGSGISAKELLG